MKRPGPTWMKTRYGLICPSKRYSSKFRLEFVIGKSDHNSVSLDESCDKILRRKRVVWDTAVVCFVLTSSRSCRRMTAQSVSGRSKSTIEGCRLP